MTLCSKPEGTIWLRRKAIDLSIMKATARIDASKSGQIGQPAAWMMANTRNSRYLVTANFILAILFRQEKPKFIRRDGTTKSLSTKAVDKHVDWTWGIKLSGLVVRLFPTSMKKAATYFCVEIQ